LSFSPDKKHLISNFFISCKMSNIFFEQSLSVAESFSSSANLLRSLRLFNSFSVLR
jgi:hypothetical protein